MAKVTTKQIEKALRECAGVQSLAAKALGVNRSTICRRIQKSEKLQAIVAEIEDEMCDIAEGQLKASLKRGYFPAVKFYLETKGKARGYTKTVNLEAQKAIPIVFTPGQAELA